MINTAVAITPDSLLLISQIAISCLLLATGIFFLSTRQKRRLHRLLSGILLFWLLLHIKDMLLLNGPAPDKALERLCICIDILAVPTCVFLLLELTSPGWFNWRRAVIFELPFIALLAIFAIFPVKAIFYIDICCALIFSLWIIARLFRAIPDYNRILRENFSNTENLDLEWLWKLLIFFIILLSLWAYSALHISTPADILYNVSSGIMWCVICYAIYKQQPLILAEETEPVPSEPSVTTDTIRPDFTKKLAQLFDEQKIWLNPRLTLGEVAQLLGSNRTYLSDYLNHKLGTSFYEYVNEYRIRAVEKLLSSPDCTLTIEAIAENCGFNSVSTFRRVFIRRFGCTPIRYRMHQCDNQQSADSGL